ncbi:MAG: hypothetical protein GY859_30010, partial [Desulfobacterales bacterium]|nr:hypothetical protein [Desulfobacterales bacterium]
MSDDATREQWRAFGERTGVLPDKTDTWLQSIQCSRECLDTQIEMEAEYSRLCEKSLSRERMSRELTARRLSLMRVEVESALFSTKDVAQEAFLCVREDGDDLAGVAELNCGSARRDCFFMEDMEEELRRALLSTSPGDVLPPMETEDGFQVYVVRNKLEPTLDDRKVAARLESKRLNISLD